MEKRIVIVAEHFEGKLAPVTFELLAFADALTDLWPAEVNAVVLGEAPGDLARDLAESWGIGVMAVQDPKLASYNGESYKEALFQILSEMKPDYVAVAHTTQGWDFAPGLAMRLGGAACLVGVEAVFREGDALVFSRSVMNGKFVAHIKPLIGPTVLTIQPGSFRATRAEVRLTGSVKGVSPSLRQKQSRTLEIKQVKEESASLGEAEVIVAAGRGVGKKENLDLVARLAGLFPKSAVAGSRPVCDGGWLDYKQQVGLTGATVAPRLYIACGISGASQHAAGMKGSEFIVAINTDPHAAIFNIADVCVVEDLKIFIPALIETYEAIRRS